MNYPIEVYDDIIPIELQDYFYAIVYGKVGDIEIFPSIDFKIKYEKTAKIDGQEPISFMHILKSDAESSEHLANFSLIPQMTCAKINVPMRDLIYARMFLTMPYNTSLTHHDPHIDMQYPHIAVIYYLNDADGDTIFFDNKNNIIKTVTPKKGRVAVFDGSIMHAAGIPSKGPRCIVNYNILT